MAVQSLEKLPPYLRRLCDVATTTEDAVLLDRFVSANDRDAFEMLIARHGPMVLGTAHRMVDNVHDAEDVLQIVFLSLARLARTIRRGNTLPAWLHKTTCRTAAKVRKKRATRSNEEPPVPRETIDPASRLEWQEVRQALDEELQLLPERHRSPVILCYLTGLSRDEAANQLGWSLGTLKRRLEEGRKLLQRRLEKRGIAAIGLALSVLAPATLQSAVSRSLLDSSLRLVFSPTAVVPERISSLVLCYTHVTKALAMKSILAMLVVFGVGLGIDAGTGEDDRPQQTTEKKSDLQQDLAEKTVQMDDPLPAGSVLRFGTSRFRHGVAIVTMAVSPDGKTAYVASGTRINGSMRAIDLETGRTLFNIAGDAVAVAVAPDGRTIVVKTDLILHVRDARTGDSIRTFKLATQSNMRSEVDVLSFTPDGKAIATITDSKDLHLIDVESGKTIRDFVHESPEIGNSFPQVLAVAFSPDGKVMATGGYAKEKDNYFARLWDVKSGKEIRRFMHGTKGYGIRCLTFSPDGKTLATLGTQSGVFLRLFDVESGKEIRAFPKDGNQRTRSGSIAFSHDGKTVAVACGSIRLYDTTTGKERLRIDRTASNLHFSDDGKTLTGVVSGAIYRWNTTSGKSLVPVSGNSAVGKILVTPDGRRVITLGQDGIGQVWDGINGKHLRELPFAWQGGLAISPDGRFLAWAVNDRTVTFTVPHMPRSTIDGSRIRLYDMSNDKMIDRFPAFKGDAEDLAFTHDGKNLVSIDQMAGRVRIWDFESAKEILSFELLPADLKKESYFVRRTQLSPDGKTAVVTYEQNLGGRLGGVRGPPQLVRLWNVAEGKQLPETGTLTPGDWTFSPDGRLASRGREVRELATGRTVATLPDEPSIRAAAFSRDGRFLATAVWQGVIQIWEVATWTKRNEFKIHDPRSISLTFGPGGRLFSGHIDTTTLVWETRPPKDVDSVSIETAWKNLATREAGASFKSEGRLQATPGETVKLFAERVKPAAPLDKKRVERSLADLGSNVFAIRERASRTLEILNEQAIPYLEATLRKSDSTEVRTRVQKILDIQRSATLTPEGLQQLRAVMVLERIGTSDSTDLLMKWATGPAGARLTVESRSALKRVSAKPTSNR